MFLPLKAVALALKSSNKKPQKVKVCIKFISLAAA